MALEFDGVDDYASVGTARSPQIMRDQSLMLWFRPEAAKSGAADDLQVLFTLRRSGESGIVLALDHGVPLAYNIFGPRDLARGTAAVALAAWHHLAYVVDFDSSELFVDGASVSAANTPRTNRTPTQAFIGSLDGYQNLFHGALDELRVYDRAFTAAQIASVAAGTKPDDTEPLVIYLPFNEAAGARSYDRSGLGNHAELGDGVPELMPTRIRSDLP
jgi:Concanavalin A-like lectin/glucanases superfamily